ncbi:unnamed protein product, partial [Mesorhabditis spiculigera]
MAYSRRPAPQYEDPSSSSRMFNHVGEGYNDYLNSLIQGARVAGRGICDFLGLPCDELHETASTVLAVPIAIISFVWWLLSGLSWAIRKATRADPIRFVFYQAIPYIGALLYSVVTIFFPQLDTIKKIFYLLFHPIQFFLDLFAKVDQRAERVRDAVDMLGPQDTVRRRPVSRLLCSACRRSEKTCLLQPCNHFCLCEPCYNRMMAQGKLACPQCQAPVDSFVHIEL